MKTILSILLALNSLICISQNINFPDNNFKGALIDAGIDLNNDGEISEAEALEVTSIEVANKEISNLTGIEYFTNVSSLDIKNNNLTNLDLTSMIPLQNLYAANNQLQELNVAGLQGLYTISAAQNELSDIELGGLPRLTNLYINNNPYVTLDISSLPNLQRINTSGTEIASLDFSTNPKMFSITVNASPLASLNLQGLCNLSRVNCRDTPLKEIDLSECINLTALIASGSSLEEIILKNGTTEETIEINSINNLARICVDEDELEAVQNLILDLGYNNVVVDSNCDGPPVLATYYRDRDNDGYGDQSTATSSCIQPSNTVLLIGDCNDNDATIYPGAPELCDGIDNNCNGTSDEGLTQVTYYLDSDGDGYGDELTAIQDCTQPSGTVTALGDCDDNDPSIHPGAIEIPNNSVDENCDGELETSSVNTITNSSFMSYPNPVSERLFLLSKEPNIAEVEIEIHSTDGRLIFKKTLESASSPSIIDVSQFNEGIYLMHLKIGKEELRELIVVAR